MLDLQRNRLEANPLRVIALKRGPKPTAATAVAPRRPTIIWSTTLKDIWKIDSRLTGRATSKILLITPRVFAFRS